MKYSYFLLLLVFSAFNSYSAYISGTIKDEKGQPLPFANIYVKNSSYGVSSNLKGAYFLELKEGTYTIVFSYMGYKKKEQLVRLGPNEALKLHIILEVESHGIKEVEIVAKREDRSDEIMRMVRKNRKFYLEQINSYQCKTYMKTSLEKEQKHQIDSFSQAVIDSLNPDKAKDTASAEKIKDLKQLYQKEKLNFIESISETYFQSPARFKEIVLAHHDYVEKKANLNQSISIGVSYGTEDIVPPQGRDENPYILYRDISSCDFNFYRNQISFPAILQKPVLSPIASSAPLSYKFRFMESFYEDGKLIYKIEVIPIFKTESLFNGFVYVEDSSWALKAVDLKINKGALILCNEFKIIQNYEEVEPGKFVPARKEFYYIIREGKFDVLGNTRIKHSDYVINKEFSSGFFNNEVKRYAVDAFEKDSNYWKLERPITLKESEVRFIDKADSLEAYFTSEEYYKKEDSVYNSIHFWIWLTGVGHRNRGNGTEWRIDGLLNQINPFGIGGYRHKLPGHFNKEFSNDMLLETKGFVDYGFRNKDVKGKLGVGLTYIPEKFVRTFVEVGYFYERVNDYESLERVFSMSNYVRTTSFSISQRMELINGLFGELTFDYSDQDPITDLQLSKWSEILFGESNEPTDFVRYIKSELKLELKYRIKQEYIIKRNKKIILGTDYPEITFRYRKGMPGLFGSEVNFDFIEIGAGHEMSLARLGSSRWQVMAASFVNKKNLRFLEYKFFRGSDRFIFSDPLKSFQLLGPTFATPDAYFLGNYIHHFEGTLLNKIPLINRTKVELAAGGGFLMIPDKDNFAHYELFSGLERAFKIKKQLFRLGVYLVASDTYSNDPEFSDSNGYGDYTFKVGLDMFDSFSNKWNY